MIQGKIFLKLARPKMSDAPHKPAPPLWIPIGLAATAYVGALLFNAKWSLQYALYVYPRNPEMAIDALGAAFPLLLGLIHLAISQCFKSKRNSRSRRRIMIGWSIASLAVLLVAFVGFSRHN